MSGTYTQEGTRMLRVGAAKIPTVQLGGTVQADVTSTAALVTSMLDNDSYVYSQEVELFAINSTVDYNSMPAGTKSVIIFGKRTNSGNSIFITNVPEGVRVMCINRYSAQGPLYFYINGKNITGASGYNHVFWATPKVSEDRVVYGALEMTRYNIL